MIGLRSQPRNTVQLSFAVLALFFGLDSIFIIFLNLAIESGSAYSIVSVNRWDLLVLYLSYAALFLFITLYTGVQTRLVPKIIVVVYVIIAVSNILIPFPSTWAYSSLEVSGNANIVSNDGGLVIVFQPWYRSEVVITIVLLAAYTAYCASKQYRRGERSDAVALAIAVGVFSTAYCWDVFLIELGLVPLVFLTQNGIMVLLVIMSLRLSGQIVKAERVAHQLNLELEGRVEARTAELSNANKALQTAIEAADEARRVAETANRAKTVFLANMSH
ncbi:MAG: hypothetical protein KDI79_26780, partial [Anaerolineae bacterium]|nr:hypothetical protein [Anaerolineae bacterium]